MKSGGVTDLKALLVGMDPRLSELTWCFQPVADARFMPENAFAFIREEEGLCAILPAETAACDEPHFARISLHIHSDLEAVGLTAAVSGALADAGIACNVIAGLHHDHLFVPWDSRYAALSVLERLSLDAN